MPFRERTVALIQGYLRQVGVEVVLTFARLSSALVPLIDSGAVDMAEFAWLGGSAIGTDIYACGGAGNVTGYCQRLATADLNQADRILDDEQRARVLNQIDRRLAKDVPVIPLYQPPAVRRIERRSETSGGLPSTWRTRRTGGSRSSPIVVAARRTSVQPTRLEFALLDPQVARKVGIVAVNHLDEALGVVAAD